MELLDRGLEGLIGDIVESWGSRCGFLFGGGVTWLEVFRGAWWQSTLMNSRMLLGTHFAPVISSWNSPLGILWGAAKVVECWR
jgi:hypothetical protein